MDMHGIFDAKWIKAKKRTEPAAVEFFRDFTLSGKVRTAKLSITALGVFNAYINGEKAGEDVFAPGWTSYKTRLQYMTYDVSHMLSEKNNITVEVGRGWRFHKNKNLATRNIKSDGTALLCALTICYENGKEEVIISDESWRCRKSRIIYNDIYNGEVYDFLQKDRKAMPVIAFHHPKDILIPLEGEPIREQETFSNPKLIITPKGERVLDFGQEITGYVQFSAKERKGKIIELVHFEMLDKNGCVYTANLRGAKQKVKIICDSEAFTYKPSFTFYGFRYICVKGIENINPADFKAISVYSAIRQTSSFECSEPLINKLYNNILWGQRGNFLDVPTDCPQRDERLGWTGDAQVFCKTAAVNFDVKKFFDKWLADLAAEQLEDGSIPHTCPESLRFKPGYSSTGWADAAVIIPWELYLAYGDKEILRKNYSMMKKWVDKMAACAAENALGIDKSFCHPWKTDGHFGDWLSLEFSSDTQCKGKTDHGLIATAYLAYDTDILIKTGKILGFDMSYYQFLYDDTVSFFRSEYMKDGKMKQNTQTACALALHFGLTEDKKATASQLAQNVKEAGHLTTGFIGTAYLLYALSDNGYGNIAYDLLLRREYPSWLYPVLNGATTVWERWNGIHPDGEFASKTMNSFNHYAYGAVFGWMFTNMVGINAVESEPGYSRIQFKPKPDMRIPWVKGALDTSFGTVKSEYKFENGKWNFIFTVPAGCSGECIIENKTVSLAEGENRLSLDISNLIEG